MIKLSVKRDELLDVATVEDYKGIQEIKNVWGKIKLMYFLEIIIYNKSEKKPIYVF